MPTTVMYQSQLKLECYIWECCTNSTAMAPPVTPDRCAGCVRADRVAGCSGRDDPYLFVPDPDPKLTLNLHGTVTRHPSIGFYKVADGLGVAWYLDPKGKDNLESDLFVLGWMVPEVPAAGPPTNAIDMDVKRAEFAFNFSYNDFMMRKQRLCNLPCITLWCHPTSHLRRLRRTTSPASNCLPPG